MVMVVLVGGWCGDDGAKFWILRRNYSAVVAIAKVQRWNCCGLILMVLMIVDVVAGGGATSAGAQQFISCGQLFDESHKRTFKVPTCCKTCVILKVSSACFRFGKWIRKCDVWFCFEETLSVHVSSFPASEFNPDFTIISAGFDAARGDPLGCCDVTPAGYAQMTHMCSALSGGKLLVILEGGYNLRSISSSATAVIKVLGPINAYHECNE
ncbi:UNVERIFIED_CONTAM: Histone deacetylase 15 [Sesamum angustifolium]|uniref:histone deacetylase n=1 Tax=Sesamum angustifolium TaxID=2727405 RepID=A0AAW2RPG3_9LAMI